MAQIYAVPGWKETKPRTRFERYQLARTHPECFLFPTGTPTDPGVPHYPICTRSGEVSCPGLLAAYRRLMVYGKRYGGEWEKRARDAIRKVLSIASRYADPSDPANVCNFVFRARETVKQRGLGGANLMGIYRHCIAYKQTRAGKRCAKYAPGPGPGVSGLSEPDVGYLEEGYLGDPGKYRHCVAWKMTKAGRRCARYAPGPGPVSGASGLSGSMAPGECRYTRAGVKYCYIPGRGVRFVGK